MFSLVHQMAFFVIGSVAGISMGTIGMGAGLIAVPLLIHSGLTVHQSISVIMLMQLLPQSLPGVYNYREHILLEPSVLVIVGSIFGIWLGSHLVVNNYLKEAHIYRIITIFLFISSIYFYYKHWD